jgi:DNA polymerase III epsilon subunit-like protein
MNDSDWRNGVFVVIDTETTGKDVNKDRPVEIAFVVIAEQSEVAKSSFLYHTAQHPPVHAEARKVHGISDKELAAASRREHDLYALCPYDKNRSMFVQWGNDFDRKMIEHMDFDNPYDIDKADWIDLCSIVRFLEKGSAESYRLEDVAKRYDVPLYKAHRALPDAEATGEILRKVLPKLECKTREELLVYAKEASVWAEKDRLRAAEERKNKNKASPGDESKRPWKRAKTAAPPVIDPQCPQCAKCYGPTVKNKIKKDGPNKGREAWFCAERDPSKRKERCGFVAFVEEKK